MKNKTIGIIGGTNGLGACFAEYWSKKGLNVLVSGRQTERTNRDLAEQSDILIFAVPISSTVETIESVKSYASPDKLWIDFTSIKLQPVAALNQTVAQVCGLHPIFGPMPDIRGEKIVYCPQTSLTPEGRRMVQALFGDFELLELTADEHDQMMGVIQCVSHFSDFVMGKTLQMAQADLAKIWKHASPSYQLKLDIMGRMFAQNPKLYSDISYYNVYGKPLQKLFGAATNQMIELLNQSDDNVETELRSIGESLGREFCQEAHARSQSFLPAYRSTKDPIGCFETPPIIEKYSIAIFGEALSHTDNASYGFEIEGVKIRKSTDPIHYFQNIFEVFEEVVSGSATYGIVPYENSTQGSVFETLDELFKHDVQILDIIETEINQSLLVLPGTNPQTITHIYSHTQALAQSRAFLKKHIPHAKLISEASTAVAAHKISHEKNPKHAAIATPSIAKSLGLEVLFPKMELEDNRTKFVLIAKPQALKGLSVVSLVFWFGDDKAGNLAEVLMVFQSNGINLTKLDSRRASKEYGSYLFFVDAEMSEGRFGKIKDSLQPLVGGMKVLGGGK